MSRELTLLLVGSSCSRNRPCSMLSLSHSFLRDIFVGQLDLRDPNRAVRSAQSFLRIGRWTYEERCSGHSDADGQDGGHATARFRRLIFYRFLGGRLMLGWKALMSRRVLQEMHQPRRSTLWRSVVPHGPCTTSRTFSSDIR